MRVDMADTRLVFYLKLFFVFIYNTALNSFAKLKKINLHLS